MKNKGNNVSYKFKVRVYYLNKLNKDLNKSMGFKIFLKKHVNTIIFLILLTVIVSLITYYRVLVQIDIGPVSDSFDFLSNALVFAGQGTGYSDLLRPPFFSFIISLFFRWDIFQPILFLCGWYIICIWSYWTIFTFKD